MFFMYSRRASFTRLRRLRPAAHTWGVAETADALFPVPFHPHLDRTPLHANDACRADVERPKRAARTAVIRLHIFASFSLCMASIIRSVSSMTRPKIRDL